MSTDKIDKLKMLDAVFIYLHTMGSCQILYLCIYKHIPKEHFEACVI